MKNKKAISDLIGWVLLIGFTITIAAFVTTWVIDQTKKFNPEDVAGGLKMYCEDVVLSIGEITAYGTESVSPCDGEGKSLTLTLKNKGKFTIWDIKGFGAENLDYNFGNEGLVPGTTSSAVSFDFCKLTDGSTEIEIVPKIKVEDKEGYCSENTLIINDAIIDSIQ